jgi:hypothetical protein
MTTHKLTKVIFEFTDTVETLEDRPQEWFNEINGYVVLQAMRNSSGGMSHYEWKVKKRKLNPTKGF